MKAPKDTGKSAKSGAASSASSTSASASTSENSVAMAASGLDSSHSSGPSASASASASASSASGSGKDETTSSGLPAELQKLRATVSDKAALAEFDALAADEKGAAALPNMAKSKHGLEALLLKRTSKAAAPATNALTGASKAAVEGLLGQAAALAQACEASAHPGFNAKAPGETYKNTGCQQWVAKIAKEQRTLADMLRGKRGCNAAVLEGVENNLNGVQAELQAAAKSGKDSFVNNDIKYGGSASAAASSSSAKDSKNSLDIDVISADQQEWIEVKNKKPFGTGSKNWTEEVLPKAEKMLLAAKEYGIKKLTFDFPQGVDRTVADELTRMGFNVIGKVVEYGGASASAVSASSSSSSSSDDEKKSS